MAFFQTCVSCHLDQISTLGLSQIENDLANLKYTMPSAGLDYFGDEHEIKGLLNENLVMNFEALQPPMFKKNPFYYLTTRLGINSRF